MKAHSVLILKKWFQGFIELLVFFPIILLIGINLLPLSQFWIWIGSLLLCNLIGILLRITLGDIKYIYYFFIGLIFVLAINWVIIGWGISYIIGSILSILLVFRGIQFIEYQWDAIFPGVIYMLSMILHLILFFIFSRAIALKPFFPWIMCSGFAMLLISFFRMNGIEIKSAVMSEGNQFLVPASLKHHNKIFTLVIMGTVFLLGSIKQITDGILWITGKVLAIIGKVLFYLMSLISSEPQDGMPQNKNPFPFLPPAEAKEPSIFDKIIEIVGWIIFSALIIAFLFLIFTVLYKGIKRLYELIQKLFEQRKGMEETYYAYEDEKETLMDWRQVGKQYFNQLKSWVDQILDRETKWSDLKDNRERIRYLYRHFILRLIQQGYSYKPHLTPSETIRDIQIWNEEKGQQGDELKGLYEKARYGKGEISKESIEKIKKAL